jgi:hypothetical protein
MQSAHSRSIVIRLGLFRVTALNQGSVKEAVKCISHRSEIVTRLGLQVSGSDKCSDLGFA